MRIGIAIDRFQLPNPLYFLIGSSYVYLLWVVLLGRIWKEIRRIPQRLGGKRQGIEEIRQGVCAIRQGIGGIRQGISRSFTLSSVRITCMTKAYAS